jgi:hypothetical protein
MNIYGTAAKSKKSDYSDRAWLAFEEIESRVQGTFRKVEEWRGWKFIGDPATSRKDILAFVSEMYRAVCWYQPHTTEAAFHMIGRLPKGEVKLMQALACHKAEEAEHGLWAREDLGKLGSLDLASASPASFAVAAVWWRMAMTEDPLGYLGAEYLYEQLTALATKAALPVIENRQLPRDELRFVIEHATEDAKHATFLKHHILDVVTRHPDSTAAMNRCLEYFLSVWPLPVWEEAFQRVVGAADQSSECG